MVEHRAFPCPFTGCQTTRNANFGIHSFGPDEIGRRWQVDASGVKRWWCRRHAQVIADRLNALEEQLSTKAVPVDAFCRIIKMTE